MLFDMTANVNSRKVPILHPDYPYDVTLNATDGTAAFHVALSKHGRPQEYTYQWYVDGTAVPGATGQSYYRDVSADKGRHTVYCDVTNKAGTVRTRNATLTVKKVTSLDSRYPADSSAFVGEIATFYIATTEFGYPESYTCQWYVNGVAVPGATHTSFNHIRSIEGTDTVYCVVTNEAGSVQTRVATFTAQRIYLYNYGDTCDVNSGGWIPAWTSSNPDASYPSYMMEFGTNYIAINGKTNQYDGACGTARVIDLSKVSRLNAIAYTNDPSNRSAMHVSSSLVGIDTYAMASVVLPTTQQTITLDISNITSGYITFSAHGGEAPYASIINAVWLG